MNSHLIAVDYAMLGKAIGEVLALLAVGVVFILGLKVANWLNKRQASKKPPTKPDETPPGPN